MSKYLSAEKLGILPEELKALIAFIEAPVLGRVISLNGESHYYDQCSVYEPDTAEENECGTAGCVAGFVFAHAKKVQGLRKLRGAADAEGYMDRATAFIGPLREYGDEPAVQILFDLYKESGDHRLTEARVVVEKALKTGKVMWNKYSGMSV